MLKGEFVVNNKYDFCIKNPIWQRNIFIGFLIFGAVGAVVMTIFWLIFQFDWGFLVGAMIMFAFPILLSPLGLYIWYKEKFYFQNETFTYVKPFSKSQSAAVSQISRVEISTSGLIRVTFIGKNGEKLLSFLDNGTSFRNNHFIAALMHYNIPVITK